MMKGEADVRTDTLLEVASRLGVEVWELLVPPAAEGLTQISSMAKKQPDVAQALSILEKALAETDPAGLSNLLETIGLLVSDPGHKDARRQYVLALLSGEVQAVDLQRAAGVK